MAMILKPLLAPRESPSDTPDFFSYIKFPVMISPKIDGIRGMAQEGVLYSRTLKRIPSRQAQQMFGRFRGLDGELVEGMPLGHDLLNRTSQYIRSANKPGDLHYYVFDLVTVKTLNDPFIERYHRAMEAVHNANAPGLKLLYHYTCNSLEELLYMETEMLSLGYEGLMIRNPHARYKAYARATMLDNIIFKLKRFKDDECIIIGFLEGEVNENAQKKDERGYATRSKAKDGMRPSGTVGTILGEYRGKRIKVAPGSFKKDMLKYMWENQDEFIGAVLKFRYFEFGMVNELRFARAIALRDEFDIVKERL